VPPATTRYRFYMSCDDQCWIKLGSTPGSDSDATEITYQDRASGFRSYYTDTDLAANPRNKRISDWVSLQAGQAYYLETLGRDGDGGDHFSVGLEIEQTAISGHHHAIREVQEIGINVTQNHELTKITVNNPDNTKYKIMFTSSDLKQNLTKDIVGTWTGGQVNGAISDYYHKVHGNWPDTTRVMYDSNGNVTTNAADSVKNVYTVQLRGLRGPTPTTVSATAVKSTASSPMTITVDTPSADTPGTQLSSNPLRGKYRVKCVND